MSIYGAFVNVLVGKVNVTVLLFSSVPVILINSLVSPGTSGEAAIVLGYLNTVPAVTTFGKVICSSSTSKAEFSVFSMSINGLSAKGSLAVIDIVCTSF